MFEQDKIKAIYEKVANKTLSFGCKILEKYEWKNYTHTIIEIINESEEYYFIRYMDWIWNFNKLKTKIIWHPVMIWDVLDYIENFEDWMENKIADEKWLYFWSSEYNHITYLWHNKRLPIEEQSEECIDYVYNLIFEKW